jgi:hypothetical protein
VLRTFPGFKPPAAQLFELANRGFDPEAFRGLCETFATFDTTSAFDDLWFFSFSGGPKLIVGIEVEATGRGRPNGWREYRQLAVSGAVLSICWWETYQKSDHERLETWQAERAEFDRFYAGALAYAMETLGPPQILGADNDEDRHCHAIWRGKTGLLILQQSCYDPQFGLDVNYWIQPWSGPDPRPTMPFIDWLTKLSQ